MSRKSIHVSVRFLMFSAMLACAVQGSVSVQPGYFFGHDLRASQSVVYVLDLSGSMRERSGSVVEQAGSEAAAKAGGTLAGAFLGRRAGHTVSDNVRKMQQKIEKVKLHLIASLNGLPRGSQFNVVLFSSGVQQLSPVMLEVTPASVGLVSAFVSRLEAGGSTSLGSAIGAGLHAGGSHVIVLTDGLPTDASPGRILDTVARENASRALVISTVGVGNDQDFGFLKELARQNGGAFVSYN